MTPATDQLQRVEALEPTRSFIVEAPAGSGKTELLIQRYLKLLSQVERPEQVVAITFTRKAAAEMRQRVIETLRASNEGDDTLPEHRRQSLGLAGDVLRHAERAGWALLDQPRRLRITTIDALSTSLAQQLPVPAGGVGGLAVTDKPGWLFALAAKRTTESLAETSPLGEALGRLLLAADNSLAKLDQWLAGTLSQRDGWLRELAEAPTESLADRVATNLQRLAGAHLAELRRLVDAVNEDGLHTLLSECQAFDPESPESASADAAHGIADEGTALDFWRDAAALLLKRDGGWRRRFTKAEGFPAGDTERRKALDILLQSFHQTLGLRECLAALSSVPEPIHGAAQQELLPALELVLPHLLAELRVLFEEHAVVDHTELALAAERALGTADAPSELLLALDRRIEHILVDEFQDTSHLQWRLFEKLTAGWERGDGRTLFLVGDPMQSIYRFRDADLSLFLRAAETGLGSIRLDSIALKANYRSAPEIVAWVNATFSEAFPSGETHHAGMPAYRSAAAAHPSDPAASVELHIFGSDDTDAETFRVVDIVRDELKRDAAQSIAILVRSRTHLKGLRAAFRSAGQPVHAVEIDSLSDTQLGQDLIGLTSALLHPADRLSWLGVLRSPWCGLDWSDLLALCGGDKRTVWECLGDASRLARLSEAGRRKTAWLRDRLCQSLALRPTRSLSRWIRESWLLLDGPAALSNRQDLELAERFFASLAGLARFGDIEDPAGLRRHFSEPVAGTDAPADTGVEIMTMHRAKGLEFDTVLLPALGRLTRGIEDKLLYYQSIHLPDGHRLSLLAAASGRADPVRDYLRSLERRHDEQERARLLYVASTRARKRLHLIGSVDSRRGTPRSGSLLATLWRCLEPKPDIVSVTPDGSSNEVSLIASSLRCLSFAGDQPELPLNDSALDQPVAARPEFQWVNPASVQVGTLIHRELQQLAELAAQAGAPVAPRIDLARYRSALELLGVENDDLETAARRVAEALEQVWEDPVGRWILKPWPEAWSEQRLTIRGRHRLDHVQLDRSFVDENGVRWIIDYKTGRHLGGDPEGFLDSEVERYRGQLERYAHAVGETEQRPIRVGIYFPLMARLREWEPASPADSS